MLEPRRPCCRNTTGRDIFPVCVCGGGGGGGGGGGERKSESE